MQPLEKALRNKLERTVKDARDIAEEAANASLNQLGVGEAKPFSHLTEDDRKLRVQLRAHGRQLGDNRNGDTQVQEIERLIEEVAYEHWHRMLFARFLAENNLLMYPDPDDPVPVTLQDCEDLAHDEGAKNGWELAAKYAARMLPQIFRIDSPVFQLTLPPEHQQRLERLIADLSVDVFTASDSLGWVYQFWQAKKKEEVNASEVKIGARELPAVTQLFTEPYMVSFLLDNSLGAWWAARRLSEADLKNAQTEEELRQKASLPGVPLEYLRFVKVEAASSRLKEIDYFHKDEEIANLSGNLPHWRQEGVTYFVTFRTSDSLPQEKLKSWQTEKDEWLKQHPEPHDEKTKKEFYEKFSNRIQKWLDQGYGECLLKHAEYKTIVENALKHFDGDRYDLDDFVVMPNHIHVLVTPKGGHDLSGILHSWKSFTANEINKAARRSGVFWQKESFDHIVRNPAQLEKIRLYIRGHSACKRSGSGSDFQSLDKKRQDAASTIWQPAAGTFGGWPKYLSELKTLDPCCGSGHFLVAAFLMLVPMRIELEDLTVREAVDAVLRENIHGLEIDKRCVELAAFALAIEAWKYPDSGGYRQLPEMNVACSGLSVSVPRSEWEKLANGDSKLRLALVGLYEEFKYAPVLGSLIDPMRTAVAKLVQWDGLATAVETVLQKDRAFEEREIGVTAQGLAKAAQILAGKYYWMITNVPYLKRGKQGETLRKFSEKHYPKSKNDLATVFLDRCLELSKKGGSTSIVLPQNWLFLTSYKKFREKLLKNDTWHLIARLGSGAFETISGEVVKAILISLSRGEEVAMSPRSGYFYGLDVSEPYNAEEKATGLLTSEIKGVEQAKQLDNPDARVVFDDLSNEVLLANVADYGKGSTTGDCPRFLMNFWEFPKVADTHVYWLNSPNGLSPWSGRGQVCKVPLDDVELNSQLGCRLHGQNVFNRKGVVVNKMKKLEPFLYSGSAFDDNVCPICPTNNSAIPVIWAYVESSDFHDNVRAVDQSLKVTAATITKVPFDLDHWTKVAEEKYPNGLPKPYSDDPTQWIFHGHPSGSVIWDEEKKRLEVASTLRTDATVLQVAVACLLGYRWPAELESGSGFQPLENKRQDGASTMELSDESRAWVEQTRELLPFADEDGIVCISPLRGESSAADRLINLLAAVWESGRGFQPLDKKRQDAASTATFQNWLGQLLKNSDHVGKTLDTWLRDKFFIQHCKLFHHRPFIWHIWDGMHDGFAALVNYHKLDYKNLETLIYTYLGDWITRQKQDIANGIDGAQEKLAAAESLKKKLELILEGEAPYDIFVRWKPIEKQPMGWNPDLNDGVRLNIRPFMSVPDLGKRGAGCLRDKPNIHWKKDRGKDVKSAPWYHLGPQYGGNKGDRINDHHLRLAEKSAAREAGS
ncbi:MAG: N-6 DNA methylase [Desulfobacteraceae bacterium]|jgi:REP element-mobilizing transposase RayT|nr:N-6 DNA methylase [Desulfobacteraceae bacterium]